MICARTHNTVIILLHSELYVFTLSFLHYSSHRLFLFFWLLPLFAYFCLIFHMPLYIKVSDKSSWATEARRPHVWLFQDKALLRLFSIWVDVAWDCVKFSSATQWSEMSISCPVLPSPSTLMKTIELKGIWGSFSSRIMISSAEMHWIASSLVVTPPSSPWMIPWAGCSSISDSPFPCQAFKNLTPNRSPCSFYEVILWNYFLLSSDS